MTLPNIVLVHGAWADGSSWRKVIEILDARGFEATAVQLPLSSLADDVAATRRVLAVRPGPTVVVGHSYGGVVITEAAAAANVRALVYVAAFVPDAGESVADLSAHGPPPPGAAQIRPDEHGWLWLDRAGFPSAFCADLERTEARVLAAVQQPLAGACFGAKVTTPAWRGKPSFYQVSDHDQMIPPDAQRRMAQRIGAHTITLAASHASLLSRPREISELIVRAAT